MNEGVHDKYAIQKCVRYKFRLNALMCYAFHLLCFIVIMIHQHLHFRGALSQMLAVFGSYSFY